MIHFTKSLIAVARELKSIRACDVVCALTNRYGDPVVSRTTRPAREPCAAALVCPCLHGEASVCSMISSLC